MAPSGSIESRRAADDDGALVCGRSTDIEGAAGVGRRGMRFGGAGRTAIEGGRVKVNRRGESGSVGGGRWPTSAARLSNFSW